MRKESEKERKIATEEEEENEKKRARAYIRASFDLCRRVYRMTLSINHMNGGIDVAYMSHRAGEPRMRISGFDPRFDGPDEWR